jgi:hypothetical protein
MGAKVSSKSKTSTYEYPLAISLVLFVVTTPNSSSLLQNTHLVPTTFCFGLSTKDHTWFLLKLLSSSCIATTQSESHSASSTLKGSKEETKLVMFTKSCNTRSSGYSLLYGTKDVVDQMVTLNDLSNYWMRES